MAPQGSRMGWEAAVFPTGFGCDRTVYVSYIFLKKKKTFCQGWDAAKLAECLPSILEALDLIHPQHCKAGVWWHRL